MMGNGDSTVNVERLGMLLASLLAQAGPALLLRDPSGCTAPVRPDTAGTPDGLLLVFAVAADAVWREATGHGFGLDVRPDPESLLGFRLCGARAGSVSAMLLCILEAMHRAAGPNGLVLNDLVRVTRDALPDPAPTLPAVVCPAAAIRARRG